VGRMGVDVIRNSIPTIIVSVDFIGNSYRKCRYIRGKHFCLKTNIPLIYY
jgi:hypothetical protein